MTLASLIESLRLAWAIRRHERHMRRLRRMRVVLNRPARECRTSPRWDSMRTEPPTRHTP